MERTNKSLKEWNAVIEALGQGKQTILIRKYGTKADGFLLYPTVSYAIKDNYLEMFKDNYHSFVEENALPKKENEKTEVKYFAKCENIIEKSSSVISRFDKYHIWNKEHVRSYLDGKKCNMWLLRVYKLKKPYMAEPNRGMLYSNLKKEVDVSGLNPVINDKKFSKISEEILNK